MKITIDTGGSPYVLVPGGQQSPEDLRMVTSDETQIVKLLRSVGVVVYNRGNSQTVLTFQLTTDQGNVQAAEVYFLTNKLAIPTSGLITLICQDPAGILTDVPVYLLNATVHRGEPTQVGRGIVYKYTITGGQLTLTHP